MKEKKTFAEKHPKINFLIGLLLLIGTVSSRFCGAFIGCEGQISASSHKANLYVMKKKNGINEILCFCSLGIPISLWRVLSPWLTKEIIFVCTVFLSFTLWMTCERTLIFAQSTSWIAPQNLQFTLWNSRLSLGSAARNLDWRISTTWILHATQPWLNKK